MLKAKSSCELFIGIVERLDRSGIDPKDGEMWLLLTPAPAEFYGCL
jgi:hypothetical protein